MNATQTRSLLVRGRTTLKRHHSEVLCGAVLLLMAINFIAVISRKSLTNDEKYHIPAGYYHLVFGDFQLNPEHPPLVKMLAAVPLVFIHPSVPTSASGTTEKDPFFAFWEANTRKFDQIAFWARVPMIGLSLLLGIIVFSYTRELGGNAAGLLAVAMFTLEPTILAHGRVVQTDVPAGLAYFLFFFALHRVIKLQSLSRVVLLGVTAGLALVVKFSLLIVVPIFIAALVLLGWRSYKSRLPLSDFGLKLVAAVVAFLLLINIAYYFERTPLLPENRLAIVQEWPTHATAFSVAFHGLSTIVPPTYLFGIFIVNRHNNWGHYASLLGNYSREGWWYYFPLAFALKTTLPFLMVTLVSLCWSIWITLRRHDYLLILPIIAVASYTAFSMTGHINIGVRHFLPVFPFLFLLSGIFLSRVLNGRGRQIGIVLLIIMFSWMAFEAVRAFPNYIPFMNQLAWSHPHWYYLSDSNVEWGDDTGDLADYLLDHGETRVRAAILGGWQSKLQYGVDFINPLVIYQPVEQTRYIAIGASYLNGSTVPLIRDQSGNPITEEQRRNFFSAYRQRQPEAVFGNSIYLYRERE